MNLPEHFHLSGDYVSYRPKGEVTFAQLIDLCSSAVSFARLYDIKCLLADTTQLTGFGPPSTLERFEFAAGAPGRKRGGEGSGPRQAREDRSRWIRHCCGQKSRVSGRHLRVRRRRIAMAAQPE